MRLLALQSLSALFEKGLFTARLANLDEIFHPSPAPFVGVDRHLEGAPPQFRSLARPQRHLSIDAGRGGEGWQGEEEYTLWLAASSNFESLKC
jgi:hypothetical protein